MTIQDVDSDWRGVCGTEVDVAADGVCLSFGFVPQLELPHLLGCSIRYQGESGDFAVVVDANMRTTIEAVFAAGETTGIAGVRVSRVEGQIAGLTAAFDAGVITRTRLQSEVEPLQRVARHLRVFSEWMRLAFRPRPGLWELAEPNTIVCRCEDVDLAQVDGALAANDVSLSAVKSDTRAGMGLCQGRVCGPYIVERLRETSFVQSPGWALAVECSSPDSAGATICVDASLLGGPMSARQPSADVVVVGAGVIGAACACALSAAGLRVTILERDGLAAGTSRACQSGIGFGLDMDDYELAWSLASNQAYRDLAAQGADIDYVPCGALIVTSPARRSG